MTPSIKAMLEKPGLYAISDHNYLMHGGYVRVEVAEDGTVYQLNLERKRDGELPADGWRDSAVCLGDLLLFEAPKRAKQ